MGGAKGDKETQVKIEAYGAIQEAKEILNGLAALEQAFNEMIFKKLGEAWSKLDAAEVVFGPDFVEEVWIKRYKQEEGQEA